MINKIVPKEVLVGMSPDRRSRRPLFTSNIVRHANVSVAGGVVKATLNAHDLVFSQGVDAPVSVSGATVTDGLVGGGETAIRLDTQATESGNVAHLYAVPMSLTSAGLSLTGESDRAERSSDDDFTYTMLMRSDEGSYRYGRSVSDQCCDRVRVAVQWQGRIVWRPYTTLRFACMVLLALRACRLSEARRGREMLCRSSGFACGEMEMCHTENTEITESIYCHNYIVNSSQKFCIFAV